MRYKIKSRIWIESGDNVFLGEGRVRLLKAIETKGSLSRAAATLKMSYKKAWTLLDAINKSAEKPVVITSIGGKNGGGAKLTLYGKSLITAFETLNQKCWKYLDKHMDEINEL